MLLSNLLLGCGGPPPTADTSGWATWRRVDNAYAERFQIWERGADRLLLVFGHGGIQDTVGRYVVTTDDPSPLPVSALQLRHRALARYDEPARGRAHEPARPRVGQL
ncbi:MAG TPA: hypothetical protein PL002_17100, partial [Flavobacteriales bacterium]|nr:hypothetical protein [Flavobacteriales bacterium]